MSEVVKEVLAKSKYGLPKALDMRLKIQALRIDLASRQYECVLLNKALDDMQAEYRKILCLNEKGEYDENVK